MEKRAHVVGSSRPHNTKLFKWSSANHSHEHKQIVGSQQPSHPHPHQFTPPTPSRCQARCPPSPKDQPVYHREGDVSQNPNTGENVVGLCFYTNKYTHTNTHTHTQRCVSLSATHTELRGWCTEWPLVNPDRFPQPPTNCHSQSLHLLSLLINIIKTLHLHMSPPGGSTLSLVVPSGPSCLSTNPWRGDALHLIISFVAYDSLDHKHDIIMRRCDPILIN